MHRAAPPAALQIKSGSAGVRPFGAGASNAGASIGTDPKSLVGRVLKYMRHSDAHPAVTLVFEDNSAVQVLVDGYNPRSARVVTAAVVIEEDEGDVFGPGSGPRLGRERARTGLGSPRKAGFGHGYSYEPETVEPQAKSGNNKRGSGSEARGYGDMDMEVNEEDLGYEEAELFEDVQLEMDATLSRFLSTPGSTTSVGVAIRDCAMISLTDRALTRSGERYNVQHQAFAIKFEEETPATPSTPNTPVTPSRIRPRWHCIWATRVIKDSFGVSSYNDGLVGGSGRCVARTFDDVYLKPLVRSPPSPTKSPTKGRFGHGQGHGGANGGPSNRGRGKSNRGGKMDWGNNGGQGSGSGQGWKRGHQKRDSWQQ